jgi:tetratricopeptide (TPR) repeat protein
MAGDHVNEYEEILGYHLEQAYRFRSELGPLDDEGRRLGTAAARHLGAAGQRAALRGDMRAARKLLDSAVQLMPVDSGERFRLVADLGAALSVSGELRRADRILAEAIEDAEAAGDVLGQAHVELVRIGVQSTLGQLKVEDVVRRSAELLEIFIEHGDEWGIDHATWELARHHFFAGRARVAEELLTARLATYRAGEQPLPLLYGFLNASRYWGPTPIREAMAKAEQMDVSKSKAVEAIQLRTLGGLHGMIGEFETARVMLSRSFELETELGRGAMATSVGAHFFGPLEHLAGNLDQAETILRTSYEAMSATGDMAFSSTTAAKLAAVYVDMGRFDDAERFAQIALETSSPDDVDAQSAGRAVLARVLAKRGEQESALALAREAVKIAENTDYLSLRGAALANLAEVLEAAGQRSEALAAMKRAVETFDAKGSTAQADQAKRRLAAMERG